MSMQFGMTFGVGTRVSGFLPHDHIGMQDLFQLILPGNSVPDQKHGAKEGAMLLKYKTSDRNLSHIYNVLIPMP